VTRLERELGVKLLERTPRGVAPTGPGTVLHQATRAGLGALAMGLEEIERLRAGKAGRLSIATGGTTVRHFMRDAVFQFRRRHPHVALHFEPGSSTQQCLEAVARRSADVAFITITGPLRGFEQRQVLEMPVVLLVPRDDPLARRRRIQIGDLATIRYVSLSESTASHHFLNEVLAREGVSLQPTARVDDFDTANVFVELGLGHAIVPIVHGRIFERSGRVRALPIQGLPPIPVGWAARSFQFLPPVAVEFMQILLETARQWQKLPGVKVVAAPEARAVAAAKLPGG
jgi:DNA-binding transcriptional LysR family regulator